MAHTTVHVIDRGRRVFSLTAPDRSRAADVFSAFGERTCDAPASVWAVEAGGERAEVGDDSWREWCSRHPVSIVGDPRGLPARVGISGMQTAAHVVAGPDSGFACRLPPHTVTVGRGEGADIRLGDPFASRTPEPVAYGLSTVGSSVLMVDDGRGRPERERAWEWPKPPRVAAMSKPSALHLVIPLLIGIVLAVAVHTWWFLAFSLSGPLSAGLQMWLERRRIRRESAEGLREYSEALGSFAGHVRRRSQTPGIVPSRDPLTVCLGFGVLQLPDRVQEPPDADESWDPAYAEACRVLERRVSLPIDADARRVLAEAPINIDLRRCAVEVCGSDALSAVRALCAQISAGPGLVIHGDAALRRAPELVAAVSVCRCVRGEDCSSISAADADVPTLWVCDDRFCLSARPGGAGSGLAADSAPPRIVLEVSAGRARAVSVPDVPWAVPVRGGLSAARMSADRFVSLCPHTADRADGWAEPVSFDELALDAEADAVPIGIGPDGPVGADLFADGPHALVAGTTGSGKSVLLQTWIAALCRSRSPDELRLILMDFKGGAAFSDLADLPHVESCSDNLDLRRALRTLRSVQSEVRRREALLKASGCADVDAHNASGQGPQLARIVLVIDEFQVLTQDFPPGVEALESLTALGRSLGIHAILATQRPAGVISSRMRTNIALRICMRVRDAGDSLEVLDSPDAADIAPDRPGMGLISDGHRLQPFRAACLDIAADTNALVRWELTEGSPRESGGASGECALGSGDPTAGVLDQLREMRRPAGRRRITPEPLPEMLPYADGEPPGLIDLPDEQAVVPWSPQPDVSTAIVGGPSTGKSSLLRLLARTAGSTPGSVLLTRRSASGMVGGLLVVHHSDAWLVEYALGLLEEAVAAGERPAVFIDDFEQLTSEPHVRMRFEAILPDMHATVVCDRRTLHSAVGNSLSRRIFFPPTAEADAVFCGLSAGRFAGFPPAGRAVLVASDDDAGGRSIGADGVDLQVAHCAPSDAAAVSPLPRRGGAYRDRAGYLGFGPCGEPVVWDPADDGSVLTVIGPMEARRAAAESQPDCFSQLDVAAAQPHEIAPALTADAAVLGRGLHDQLSFGSPAERAAALGPQLIVGARSPAELAELGHRHLPAAPPGLAWFVTRRRAVPVRLTERTGQ